MAVKLLVPWMGLCPGDVVDRGEALDVKLLAQSFGVRVTVSPFVEKAKAEKPKDQINGKP
jgi:hypothetical protein